MHNQDALDGGHDSPCFNGSTAAFSLGELLVSVVECIEPAREGLLAQTSKFVIPCSLSVPPACQPVFFTGVFS